MVIKGIFKWFSAFLLLCVLAFSLFCGYLFISPNVKIEENKLAKNKYSARYFDDEGADVSAFSFSQERVELCDLPSYLPNAFIAVEDKRFFEHNGIDLIGMARALKNNLFSNSVKQGGSTITQQLIKNTHLSSEKTLSRKIKEIKLALKLERRFSKEEILSYYLNGVYFGEGAYGVENAARNYFAKSAKDLSLVEACALASTVKAPAVYNPRKQRCEERKNLVLRLMKEQNYISEKDYQKAISQKVSPVSAIKSEYLSATSDEVFDILKISPYEKKQIEVYTYLNQNYQRALEQTLIENNQGGIIMSGEGKIKAYKLSEGDFERSPASTVKPLVVYAPAIEEGIIHIDSKILDEKCKFGDYCPSNYGDKYYGYISAREALIKSLNVPAVKIMDVLGTKKARLYARKLGFEINEEGLGIALGSYAGGTTLQSLCSAYTPFLSQGNRYPSTFIKKIVMDGKTVYQDESHHERVFSHGCCDIINYALSFCPTEGTAKAIGKKNYTVCAKTGTAGNKKGNTDAYTVCYTSQDIIALRFANKDNSYLENSITGAHVAKYANEILDEIYQDHIPNEFERSNEVTYAHLCALAYENSILSLAFENEPTRYVFDSPILNKYIKSLPISSFSTPSVDYLIKVEGTKINIDLIKNTHVYCIIERTFDHKTTTVYDGNANEFCDTATKDGVYSYALTPYVILNDNQKLFGEKIILPDIIISFEEDLIQSPWWDN